MMKYAISEIADKLDAVLKEGDGADMRDFVRDCGPDVLAVLRVAAEAAADKDRNVSTRIGESALMILAADRTRDIIMGTRWKCIDEGGPHGEELGKICRVTEYNNAPGMNGDGDITLMYEDGTIHHGKVRRFTPGITHDPVKDA